MSYSAMFGNKLYLRKAESCCSHFTSRTALWRSQAIYKKLPKNENNVSRRNTNEYEKCYRPSIQCFAPMSFHEIHLDSSGCTMNN